MADGRDDNFNFPARRGSKLRSQGSNPTGSQTMSFTPEYSDEMDYTENVALNKRTRAQQKNHNSGYGPLADCCKEHGLNLKEPLS